MNAVYPAGLPGTAPHDQTISLTPEPATRARVALLVQSDSVPNWIREFARSLETCDYAQLVSIIICRSMLREPFRWDSTLFRLWNAFDRRLNSCRSDAFACSPVSSISSRARVIDIGPEPHSESALQRLHSENLDVILAVDSQIPTETLSRGAKYGIWSLRPATDAPDTYCTATVLAATTGPNSTRVLYFAHSSRNDVSPYLGQQADCWKGVQIILRNLAALRDNGWDTLCATQYAQTPDTDAVAGVRVPGNVATARLIARWFAEALRYEFNSRLRKQQWFVAFRPTTSLPMAAADMNGFRLIVPPRDRFYADPFIVQHEGRHYLFFEDFRYQLKRGLISFVEINSEGQCGEPEVVLDRPYHLSYPNVFFHEGEWFMMPETRDSRAVELYRATDFPGRWQLERVLLKDVPAVDPTFFDHDGRSWMFVGGMVDKACPNDELFLFSADSLLGTWKPHPKNPVVSDVRRARPAGGVFTHSGALIRPSQDCSRRYGFAVSFNRIDVLSESAYVETPIGYVSPDWHPGNLGTHTFNQNEFFQVVDGRVLVFKP